MAQYEYKILRGRPCGTRLRSSASQELKDKIGPGSFERQINSLASEGWDVVSLSTVAIGVLFYHIDVAVVLLRREMA